MADNFSLNYLKRLLDDNRTTRNTYTLRLFKNNYTPTVSSVAGDFTECDFSGYAAQGTTGWGAAFAASGNTRGESDDTVHLFQHDGGATANDVYGFYLTNGAGAYVYGEKNPAGPVTMNDATDIYAVVPRLQTVSA